MRELSSTAYIVVSAVVLLVLVFSQAARRLTVGVILVALLFAAKRTFLHGASCPANGIPCQKLLMDKSYAGVCWSSDGGAVRKQTGQYLLVADGRQPVRVTCIDARFWADR